MEAQLLLDAFGHRRDTYALQTMVGEKVQYIRQQAGLTLGTVQAHLTGGRCVGVYQLAEDSTVGWSCLDLDGGPDRQERVHECAGILIRTAAHFGLRVLPEHSGKKGIHLWLFSEPTPAVVAQRVLRGLVRHAGEDALLGISIERFPKQPQVSKSFPFGNLVKLPWGKRLDNGIRGLFLDLVSLEVLERDGQIDALQAAIEHPHSAAELTELADENDWQAPSPIVSGNGARPTGALPCYERIIDPNTPIRIRQGQRDNVLYAFAKQQQRRGLAQPEAATVLMMINRTKCAPPLDEDQVAQKVGSAYRSGRQGAGCEILQDARLCPALEGTPCPIYGMQEEEQEERRAALNSELGFSIEPLSVSRTDPPIYTATIEGKPLRLTLDQLMSLNDARKRCVSELNFIPIMPRVIGKDGKRCGDQPVWLMIVNEALKSLTEEDPAPEDASTRGAVWEEIRQFIAGGRISENREDVNKGWVVLDGDYYIFRGATLRKKLKLEAADKLAENELWMLVKDHGGKPANIRLTDSKQVWVWRIPVAAAQGHWQAEMDPDRSEARSDGTPI